MVGSGTGEGSEVVRGAVVVQPGKKEDQLRPHHSLQLPGRRV